MREWTQGVNWNENLNQHQVSDLHNFWIKYILTNSEHKAVSHGPGNEANTNSNQKQHQ